MASKRYRNRTCVYCGGASAEPDHVFAKMFFLANERHGLPQVPSCRDCNGKKSALETYATVAMPLACHPSSSRMNEHIECALRRLDRNERLRRDLSLGSKQVLVSCDGVTHEAALIPFDRDKIGDLMRYIGIGLVFHHWRQLLGDHPKVEVTPILHGYCNLIRKTDRTVAGDRFSANLGNGTIFYAAGFDAARRRFGILTTFYDGVIMVPSGSIESACSGWIVTIDLPEIRLPVAA
ncbi:hypothetical protein [Bradyrhizobium sp. USDA 4353]